MGGSNNICSDKTGTLTKNEMTVMEIYSEKQRKKRADFDFTKFLTENTTHIFCEG